ncbi:MAG: N-acetylglucosamine-6-phosphate deacetylase, partial [Actinobacteria bacterium]|nr:N-acetylglucosamine-6-phosphate deacetylase [Actinomycetota bacterium]
MTSGRPPLTLAAGRLLTPDRVLAPGWLTIADGRVTALGDGAPSSDGRLVELPEATCVPGFVDLHVHGGDGVQVNADTAAEARAAVARVAAFHLRHGTTALLPTTVSDSPERTLATVAGIAAAVGDDGGARVLGVHLEGPWLSPERAGAQDPEALRAIDPAEVERVLEAAAGHLRIVTLAPELPGADDLIRRLVAAGTIVSIGHTEADEEIARHAVELGASHFTHLFNAMRPLSHRQPGPIAVALTDPEVVVELIADGRHVHPLMLGMAFGEARSPVLVTDASAAAGLPEGAGALLGRLEVVVVDGAVRLADDRRTLAGSALTMDAAVRTRVRRAGV